MNTRLHNKSKILTLYQPFLPWSAPSVPCNGWIRDEDNILAEASHRRSPRLSISDISADSDHDTHIPPTRRRPALGSFGKVLWVQDMRIVILDFVPCLWHLLLEYVLQGVRIRYHVAVVNYHWQWFPIRHCRCGHIERRYIRSRVIQSLIVCFDELRGC